VTTAICNLDPGIEASEVFRYAGEQPIRLHAAAALVVIMVTDLEGFTAMLERLGDDEAQGWIHMHNQILRRVLAAHEGIEVAHTGDGIIASFRSVRRCLSCACEMQERLARFTTLNPERALRVRIGVDAGEPLIEDGRLFGACVVSAVRICSAARSGEVLVSDVVRQLASGSRSRFSEHGALSLKGLTHPVSVHQLLPAVP